MANNSRNGFRQSRGSRVRRLPKLGYYLIFTDTRETEKNYLDGMKESLPEEVRENIVIKVKRTSTDNLVGACLDDRSIDPQYRETWIVFDRDRVTDFDKIIRDAEGNDINVAWSNPCFETWLSAYFGKMPYCEDSSMCVDKFQDLFCRITGMSYEKNDSRIYAKLVKHGDEKNAINVARRKYEMLCRTHAAKRIRKPSEMYPCTTMFELVGQIKAKCANA